MKSHYKKHKPALQLAVGAWLLLVLMLYTLPVAFCGYLNTDLDTLFWYFISESAGVYGTTVLALLLCIFAALQRQGLRQQLQIFSNIFLFLIISLGGIALLNETVIKPITQIPRPSHLFLLQSPEQATLLSEFYLQDVEQRRAFLQQFLEKHPEKAANISPRVLAHWVHESGYSFPSGHSQNAFLIGTMLVFWLGLQLPKSKQYLLVLPLVWSVLVCLSRVALGVHSELDVSLGAAFGLLLAYLLSLTGVLQRVLPFRELKVES